MTLIDENVLFGALEIDTNETVRAVPLVSARASEREIILLVTVAVVVAVGSWRGTCRTANAHGM